MTYKGKHTGHVGARARVVRTAAWVGVIGLLVAGCGKIPTSGPVYHYNEPTESATKSSPAYSPSGPSEGASPSDILKGFINAGTGVENVSCTDHSPYRPQKGQQGRTRCGAYAKRQFRVNGL